MTSPTDRPRDSRALAKLLVARYGVQATAHANYQALKARDRGDQRSMERWQWIAGATREILESEPDDSEDLSA
jgi:hypothetical protein